MDESSPAVNQEVVADTTATDSAPVENKSEVAADEYDGLGDVSLSNPTEPQAKVEAETKAEPDTEDADGTVQADAEAQPQGKAEERKLQLNTEIRDLLSQRNTIRAEVEKLNAEAYQPATDEELLGQINPETGQYYNPLEAKVAAMEQKQQMDSYNNQVTEARLTLGSETRRAVTDFPMFDETSKDYSKEDTAAAEKFLEANLVFDENTKQIIGSRISPYLILQTIAGASQRAAAKGQVSAQKATEKMLANADHSSDAPTKGSADPMDDLFDRVKDFKFTG